MIIPSGLVKSASLRCFQSHTTHRAALKSPCAVYIVTQYKVIQGLYCGLVNERTAFWKPSLTPKIEPQKSLYNFNIKYYTISKDFTNSYTAINTCMRRSRTFLPTEPPVPSKVLVQSTYRFYSKMSKDFTQLLMLGNPEIRKNRLLEALKSPCTISY